MATLRRGFSAWVIKTYPTDRLLWKEWAPRAPRVLWLIEYQFNTNWPHSLKDQWLHIPLGPSLNLSLPLSHSLLSPTLSCFSLSFFPTSPLPLRHSLVVCTDYRGRGLCPWNTTYFPVPTLYHYEAPTSPWPDFSMRTLRNCEMRSMWEKVPFIYIISRTTILWNVH